MLNKIKYGLSVLKLHSKNVLLEILPEKGGRVIRYSLKTKDNTFELLRPVNPLVLFNEKKLKNLIKGGNRFKRRQDAPLAYQPAGTVYAFRAHLLYEIDTLFPFKDTRGYVVKNEEAINIDTYNDYQMAKIIYEKNLK